MPQLWEDQRARLDTRLTAALAGDLAINDVSWREALHTQGILTVGLQKTVDPLPPSPTAEDVLQILDEAEVHRIRAPSQVDLACACGYSRPVVERLASRPSRWSCEQR